MSENCPHCRTFAQVAKDAEAANAEQRDQIIALNRALAAASRRETAAKGQLTKEHAAAKEGKVIYACLDVWADCCWAGKGKPKLDINGERAGRVRKALSWEFAQADICDALRGLGLLPYRDKYNDRSATPQPGFKRAADVVEALRDETRLERFRDYYRRVRASPVDRRVEEWWNALAVADQLYGVVAAEALWERYRDQGPREFDRDIPGWMLESVTGALRRILGDTATFLPKGMDDMLARVAILAVDSATYRHEVAKRPGALTPEQWNERLLGKRNAAQQDPYDPDEGWEPRHLFVVPDPESEEAA